MQHRDKICILKMIEEIDIGIELLGQASMEQFLENEMLKRAMGMTCINIGELVKVITADLRHKYREFPWRAGCRNERYYGAQVSNPADGRCIYDSS